MLLKTYIGAGLLSAASVAVAGDGPIGIGPVSIGMSKSEYFSAASIKPIQCREKLELKSLHVAFKTLCGFDTAYWNEGAGMINKVQVGDVEYEIVDTSFQVGGFIKEIGNGTQALFVDDKLVSLEISFPNVDLNTLVSKYGAPEVRDDTEVKVCKNGFGATFNNQVGNLDSIWRNGDVTAMYRVDVGEPRKTCTDGITIPYYYIQDLDKLSVINDAIEKHQAAIKSKSVEKSLF